MVALVCRNNKSTRYAAPLQSLKHQFQLYLMDDGSKEDFSAGEIMLLPPGHDAWCVGKTACIFVEFSQGNNYYNQLVKEWHHQNA